MNLMHNILDQLKALLIPHSKERFIRKLPSSAVVIDVGCGPYFPRHVRRVRPDVQYTGIDIREHGENDFPLVVSTPETFASDIERFKNTAHAIISSHNLEHCNEPQRVLKALIGALREGGECFLAFPSEESVNLPRRRGTLNFYDDETHRVVPRRTEVIEQLRREGLVITYIAERHRPLVPFIIGFCLEPLSWLLNRTLPLRATWSLYGFESVICARRPAGEGP